MCGARFGRAGSVLLGTGEGSLLILSGDGKSISEWGGSRKVVSHPSGEKKKATKDCVATCWSNPAGSTVVVGNSSGLLRILNFDVEADKLIESSCVSVRCGGLHESTRAASIRSVCMSSDESTVLIGTQRCEVVQISLPFREPEVMISSSDSQTKPSHVVLNRGHFKDELW